MIKANDIVWEIGKLMPPGEGCPPEIEKAIRYLEQERDMANRYQQEVIEKVKGYNELRNWAFNGMWTSNYYFKNLFCELFTTLEKGESIR